MPCTTYQPRDAEGGVLYRATVKDPREIREVLAGLARSAEPVALDRAPPSRESLAANPTADVCS